MERFEQGSSTARLVWCIRCHRVWDAATLPGAWPELRCADQTCATSEPATFLPYHQTRRLMAPHWPAVPDVGALVQLARPSAEQPAADQAGARRPEAGRPA